MPVFVFILAALLYVALQVVLFIILTVVYSVRAIWWVMTGKFKTD